MWQCGVWICRGREAWIPSRGWRLFRVHATRLCTVPPPRQRLAGCPGSQGCLLGTRYFSFLFHKGYRWRDSINRWQLTLNRRWSDDDQPQLLGCLRSAEVQVYWRPAFFFLVVKTALQYLQGAIGMGASLVTTRGVMTGYGYLAVLQLCLRYARQPTRAYFHCPVPLPGPCGGGRFRHCQAAAHSIILLWNSCLHGPRGMAQPSPPPPLPACHKEDRAREWTGGRLLCAPGRGCDPASGHFGAQQPPLGRVSCPPPCGSDTEQ